MIESAASSSPKMFTKIVVAVLIIAVADLVYLNWWALKDQKSKIKNQNEEERSVTLIPPSPSPLDNSSPSPSPSTAPKTVAKTQTIIQTSQKEIFIPIGSGSTNSGAYTEIGGLEVSIDTAKYGQIESMVFESSLWVEGGNGRAYARLYNASDQYVILESQISSSSSSGTFHNSAPLPIISGMKTFKVQAKTDITNFAAHVENARIKITLK